MIKQFFILIIFIISLSFAEDLDLSNLKAPAIDRNEVSSVLDNMVAQGVITKEQAEAAKSEMKNFNDQDWNELTHKAHEVVNRDPKIKQMIKDGMEGRTPANAPEFNKTEFEQIQKAIKDQEALAP